MWKALAVLGTLALLTPAAHAQAIGFAGPSGAGIFFNPPDFDDFPHPRPHVVRPEHVEPPAHVEPAPIQTAGNFTLPSALPSGLGAPSGPVGGQAFAVAAFKIKKSH
jgi:hypothetical protein